MIYPSGKKFGVSVDWGIGKLTGIRQETERRSFWTPRWLIQLEFCIREQQPFTDF
ncbi:MAG: hypothetical protein ACPHJ3_16100 [Rubripirellula sp.]|jgi:hypothetical protein